VINPQCIGLSSKELWPLKHVMRFDFCLLSRACGKNSVDKGQTI